MLVLSRKPGEKILIGDKVQITIVRIGPNTVRLGIDAPKEEKILRHELAGATLNQHEASLESDGGPASIATQAGTERCNGDTATNR